MMFRQFLLLLCFFLLVPHLVLAQTAQDIDDANRQGNQQLQLEQQHQFEELQKQKSLPSTDFSSEQELHEQVKSQQVTCFPIEGISLDGANLLKDSEKKSITAPFIGGCIGLNEINDLVRLITNNYIEKGYVTTRAYIPQQNLSDGHLEILVIEGATVLLMPINRGNDVNVRSAFPKMIGEVLNLNDIEQGVAQLNRLSSNNVKIDLKPGPKPGETLVFIKNHPKRRINGVLSIDNSGSDTTGDWQGGGTLNFDNMLGFNERFYVGYRRNVETASIPKDSQSFSGGFFVPYGYWTLSGNVSFYDYESRINGQVQDFDTEGTSNSANVALDWMFYRKGGTTWSLTGAYTYKDTENLLEGSVLSTSSRDLSIFDLDLQHNTSFWGGSFGASIGGALGVEDFLGSDEGQAGSTAPTSGFKKIKASARYFRPFQVFERPFSLSTSVQGQFASDLLPGTEQISIGSRYSVRGFDGSSIAGDRGGYIRNELAMNIQLPSALYIEKAFGMLSPYIGYDAGIIFDHDDDEGGSLNGAAIGLRNFGGKVNFDVTIAQPLGGAESLKEDNTVYYAQFSVPF